MDPEVARALGRAREARRRGEPREALEALRDAVMAARRAGRPEEERLAAWRLAKGAFDLGELDDLRHAIDVVLDSPAPFAHHPPAVQAAEPLSRRIQDLVGYGDPRVLALWTAWREHHRREGDPWLEAQGAVQQSWTYACRWDVAAVRALAEPYLQLTPRRFGRGPTKHPDALDTTLSLYWVQADLTRILLQAATWADAPEAAADALELHLDALAAADRTPRSEPWTLDAWCRAADRFGWLHAPWAEWTRSAEERTDTGPVQGALARATLQRRRGQPAARAFTEAAQRAERTHAGWEWVVDGLREAMREQPSEALAARIAEIRSRTSVGAAVP